MSRTIPPLVGIPEELLDGLLLRSLGPTFHPDVAAVTEIVARFQDRLIVQLTRSRLVAAGRVTGLQVTDLVKTTLKISDQSTFREPHVVEIPVDLDHG